jgi:hypothetical protein
MGYFGRGPRLFHFDEWHLVAVCRIHGRKRVFSTLMNGIWWQFVESMVESISPQLVGSRVLSTDLESGSETFSQPPLFLLIAAVVI